MQLKRFLILSLIFSFGLALLPLNVQASPNDGVGPNLLTNGNFESSYVQVNPNAQVAASWTAWWTPHPATAPDWAFLQPNYGPSNTCTAGCDHRIHTGSNAQRIFHFFGAYEGGIYQQVAVPLDADVSFSIYGQGWSSQQNDPINSSIGGTNMQMKIGIDPTGGTNPYSPNIVWTQSVNALDSWYQFVVYAHTQNTTITVFTYANPFDSRRNNEIYWDDASLNVLSGDLAATAQASYPTATPVPIVYTPTPVSVSVGQNLLTDGGFEGKLYIPCSAADDLPWHHLSCDGLDVYDKVNGKRQYIMWNTVQVPIGWTAWWLIPNTKHGTDPVFYQNHPNNCYSDAPEGCVAWHNPEFRDTKGVVAGPSRIHSGTNSQKYFTFYSVHEAGLMQTVNVPPGTQLRFDVYMQAWSSNKDGNVDDPSSYLSSGQTSMHMKVGIDPTGGDDPWSPNIVWSPEHDTYDVFGYYEVRATAQADHVTVFTHSMPEKGLKHNDMYVDDAELVAIDVPAGAAISQPAAADNSAPAVINSYVPGPTATPYPDGSLVHTVKPGDTLFGLSLQYNVPMDQILQLNGLTKDSFIVIGQELVISAAASAAAPTDVPTSEATAVPTPEQIAAAPNTETKLCVRAFDDLDSNGIYTSSEPLVSGAMFTLLDAQGQSLTTYSSDGISEPHCFNKLAPGNYSIAIQPPSGMMATSDRRWSVTLVNGGTVNVNFGSHAPEVKAKPEDSAGTAGSIGLIVLGVVIGIGGFVVIQRRRAVG